MKNVVGHWESTRNGAYHVQIPLFINEKKRTKKKARKHQKIARRINRK